MKILVTGANGFVGTVLCRELSEKVYNVKGAFRSIENFSKYSDYIECIAVGEVGPDTDWTDALDGVNSIIHLASRVHVMQDTSVNPLDEYRRINTKGTKRLAAMAAKSGVRKIIYLSTIKVNGEGGALSYTELDTPAPEDPYGISKWEAEQALQKIAAETGLEVVIIRPPLVYGPGVKANFLSMLEFVKRGIPLPLASINNRRSLIYLGNLVDAIITCITHPKAVGQTYLVSDGNDVSTPELIRRVAADMGKPARLFPLPPVLIKFAGRLTGNSEAVDRLIGSLIVDSSKIRNELGWSPPYTMTDGLKETVEWFKKNM